MGQKVLEYFLRSTLYMSIIITNICVSAVCIPNSSFEYKNYFNYSIITTALLAILYITLCISFKGKIKMQKETPETIANAPYFVCLKCMQFKPERSHHCTRCNACIKKMDHHCIWLKRCVNYDNFGHFIRFLFFTNINMTLNAIFSGLHIYRSFYAEHDKISYYEAAAAVFALLSSSFIWLITGIHFYNQMPLLSNNITYIEVKKKPGYYTSNTCDYESKYDLGLYKNIVDVLGPPYLLFLWRPSGDGIYFKTKYDMNSTIPGTDKDGCEII
ncbi:hypothetical protein ENBRE01_1918 [Enteropsectra breve]|nr:hypothetical protein ENBRE01_1918 [Enteropsectra breve]